MRIVSATNFLLPTAFMVSLHINHSNPVYTDEEVIAEVEGRGFGIARSGEKVDL